MNERHECQPDEIFVFGSNLAGRHGKGAALTAKRKYGAKNGSGYGPMGRAYAIPTKDSNLEILSLGRIAYMVGDFLAWATAHPEQKFFLTRIGCGLAGYTDWQIAPMFTYAPPNVRKPKGW